MGACRRIMHLRRRRVILSDELLRQSWLRTVLAHQLSWQQLRPEGYAGVCGGQRAGSSGVPGVACGRSVRRAHHRRRRHPKLGAHCKGAVPGRVHGDVRLLVCGHHRSARSAPRPQHAAKQTAGKFICACCSLLLLCFRELWICVLRCVFSAAEGMVIYACLHRQTGTRPRIAEYR